MGIVVIPSCSFFSPRLQWRHRGPRRTSREHSYAGRWSRSGYARVSTIVAITYNGVFGISNFLFIRPIISSDFVPCDWVSDQIHPGIPSEPITYDIKILLDCRIRVKLADVQCHTYATPTPGQTSETAATPLSARCEGPTYRTTHLPIHKADGWVKQRWPRRGAALLARPISSSR